MSTKGAALALILIGLGTSGCSFTRADNTFAKYSDDDVVTGSIPTQPRLKEPTEADLAFARNAASDVLTKGDKDASQPWANPDTGARGSVTPLATSYAAEDGRTCHDFLASYVNGDTESWLQGAACKGGNGRWEIQALKPWKRG